MILFDIFVLSTDDDLWQTVSDDPYANQRFILPGSLHLCKQAPLLLTLCDVSLKQVLMGRTHSSGMLISELNDDAWAT